MMDPVFIFILLACEIFISRLSPLMLRDINDRRLLIRVILLLVAVYMCIPFSSVAPKAWAPKAIGLSN